MKDGFTPLEIIVAKILAEIENKRLSLRTLMEEYFSKHPDESVVRGVVKAYTISVLKRYRIIDTIAEKVLGIKLEGLSPFERNIIRSLIYEAKFRNVKLQRILKISKVLRNVSITRQDCLRIKKTPIRELLREFRGSERIGIEYSIPTWIVDYVIGILGKREAFKLFKAFNKKPPVWIRVNTLLIKPEKLFELLQKKGICLEYDKDFRELLRVVDGHDKIVKLLERKKGLFYIQDKSSLLVGYTLRPGAWSKIWDMCSAPGGKTSHVYQLTEGKVSIIATEWKGNRVRNMVEILRRLHNYGVEIINSDAEKPPFNAKFDGIILDPDCSSLGRLGHSPEIRLWLEKDIICRYQQQQRRLLETASRYLKRSGVIIYSTCTLTLEENEQNILWALDNLPLELENVEPRIGLPGLLGLDKTQRLYPHVHSTVGFFVAKFRY